MIVELYYCNAVIFDVPLKERHGDEGMLLFAVKTLL